MNHPRGVHFVQDPNKITKTQIIVASALAGGIAFIIIACFATIKISNLLERRKWEAIRRKTQTQAQPSAASIGTDCIIEVENVCETEDKDRDGSGRNERHGKDLGDEKSDEKENMTVIVVEELKSKEQL